MAAGAHVLFRTAPRGGALSADGLAMWSAALNFADGHGLVDFAGRPLTLWPPLLPLIMGAAIQLDLDPLEAARWVNAAAFAATVLFLGCWLLRVARRRAVALAAAVVVAASHPLNDSAAQVMTEALAILFISAALLQLDAFLHRERGRSALAAAAGCAGLAAVTRYPGAVVILVGAAALLLNRRARARARLKHAALYGVVASAPLAAILARNRAVDGYWTGDRSTFASPQGTLETLAPAASAFGTWALPGAGPEWLVHLPWLVAGGLCSAAVLALVAFPRLSRLRRARSVRADPAVWLLGGFAAAYVALMCVMVPVFSGQNLDSRMLAPAFVPFAAVAALLADRFLHIEPEGRGVLLHRALTATLVAGLATHLAFAVGRNATLTAEWRTHGNAEWAAYNSAYWDDSATLRAASRARLDTVVYSNDAELLWYRDRTAPVGAYVRLPPLAESIDAALDRDGSIVWFEGKLFKQTTYGVSALLSLPRVRPVSVLEDGMLLRARGPARTP